jgi:hypothetical protein
VQEQIAAPKSGYQHTDINSLIDEENDDQEVFVTEMNLDHKEKSDAPKDILAIAQEMAKSRESADRPVHQRKREMAQEQFSASQSV